MRRIPIIPTILVAAAIATMIALGVWQLQRMAWKERLIADLAKVEAYHPVILTCRFDGTADVRAGKSDAGEIGYAYSLGCGAGGRKVNVGWSKRPDLKPQPQAGRFAATQVRRYGQPPLTILDHPLPPLEKSGLPDAADLPNNHLAYAGQWFFFAAAAAIIYALALRRRRGS